MNFESSSALELHIKLVHIRSDSQSDDQNFYCNSTANIFVGCYKASPKDSITLQMSEFKIGHLIGLKKNSSTN